MSAAPIEGLSFPQIDALSRMARRKLARLTATHEYNLRCIVGHAMLLDAIALEGERCSEEKTSAVVAREGTARATALVPRVVSLTQHSRQVDTGTGELLKRDPDWATSASGDGVMGGDVPALVLAQTVLARIMRMASLRVAEEAEEEFKWLLRFYEQLVYLTRPFEESGDEDEDEDSMTMTMMMMMTMTMNLTTMTPSLSRKTIG